MQNKVIWMTGLSGAGKTTIAMAASKRFGCEVLDGDTIRDRSARIVLEKTWEERKTNDQKHT